MKRDWDVIREVLLKVEEGNGDKEISSEDFPEPERALVAYNMLLLREAGLVDGGGRDPSMGPPHAFVNRMTWEGHELLDSIRDDTAWNRIKETAKEKSVDLTIDTIKILAKAILESLLRGGG